MCTFIYGGLFLLGISLLCYVYLSRQPGGKGKQPPGPFRWPLLGSYPQMAMFGATKVHEYFQMIQRKYGSVARLYFGRYPMILLSGYDAIHEAFVTQQDSTTARPDFLPGVNVVKQHGKGLFFGNGETWNKVRTTLKKGVAAVLKTSAYEETVLDETKLLIDEFVKKGAEPFQPRQSLYTTATTCRYTALTGQRCTHDSGVLREMLQCMADFEEKGGILSPLGTVPLLKYLLRTRRSYKILTGVYTGLQTLMMSELNARKPNYNEKHIGSVIDAFIKDQRENPDEPSYSDDEVAVCLEECITGGIASVALTVDWALLFMLEHQDVQTACQQEIDKVCGKSRQVKFSDVDKLPYVCATVFEVQRLASVVPVSLPHCTVNDMDIRGFHIPKGTIVFSNITSSNMDDAYWENAQLFDPTRFLDDQHATIKIPPAFMPFSIGTRKCPGYTIAEKEVIVIFSNLVHTLTFSSIGKVNYGGTSIVNIRPTENFMVASRRQNT
ncbi:cytochrome P450 2J5-like [Haliotis rufescens]|uniref:cytochrome P450 2J5-like n=1 Tax=Haliotis rufescens TaxID=6454 RepID=UPI00201EA93E|nr:cytochrome P450 2J5-like [Haliotis rufescens]